MSNTPVVIIVHWGPWEVTRTLVRQLLAEPETGFDVLVFCNETEPCAIGLDDVPGCTISCSPVNLGYAGAVNAAIDACGARSSYLVVNNDIHCEPRVARRLLTAAREPGVGAVGPVTINVDGSLESAGVDLDFADPYVVQHRFVLPSPERALTACPAVQGSAIAFSHESLVEAGAWHSFYFYGWEETDWCCSLRARDRTNGIVGDARIYHTESASLGGPKGYNPIIEFMLLRNLFYFVRSWAPEHLESKVAFWQGEATTTTMRNPGEAPPDPELGRRIVESAIEAFSAGRTGRWPQWLEALRPAPLPHEPVGNLPPEA